jgi:outer membrane receptor protein involved in Fe transport
LYVEFAVPLLAGVAGAERLDLSLSARWSDYDTFGSTTNGKLGLEWQPIDDLLIRATYSEGFRAPNIDELFAGQGDSYPQIFDPCADMLGIYGGVPASSEIVNNCISQGVPADGSYEQINSQIRITVCSNPNLTPETSDSITAGLVYSPSWIDGLDITLDFYNIELTNTVSSVGSQTILDACANSLSLCNLITRTSAGPISDILAAGINLGGSEVEGVDMLVSYSFPETDWGFFRVVWDSSYQSTNSVTIPDIAGGGPDQTIEYVGFNVGDGAFARWKSNLDLNWSYGDWDATWGMQYIHGQTETCQIPEAFGFCNSADNDGNFTERYIGATTYHDVQVSYHLSDYDTRLTFGVQNLSDKGPPISTAAFANSFDAANYRVPGRFPYVRMTVDF